MNLSDATVGQIAIPVDDFDAGTAFYRDVLGLPFLFSAPPQMSFFMCGSVRLLVGALPAGHAPQRGSTVYFRVPDIHAVHASLAAKGVRFVAAPHVVHRTADSELWLANFVDPDGNPLALMAEAPIRS